MLYKVWVINVSGIGECASVGASATMCVARHETERDIVSPLAKCCLMSRANRMQRKSFGASLAVGKTPERIVSQRIVITSTSDSRADCGQQRNFPPLCHLTRSVFLCPRRAAGRASMKCWTEHVFDFTIHEERRKSVSVCPNIEAAVCGCAPLRCVSGTAIVDRFRRGK
jgi:hypothetical protein